MLAQAEMLVVIVIEETITLCTHIVCDGWESTCQMVVVPLKVPQKRVGWETIQMERVNPSS